MDPGRIRGEGGYRSELSSRCRAGKAQYLDPESGAYRGRFGRHPLKNVLPPLIKRLNRLVCPGSVWNYTAINSLDSPA